jgi:hypothetical protein
MAFFDVEFQAQNAYLIQIRIGVQRRWHDNTGRTFKFGAGYLGSQDGETGSHLSL